MTRFDFTVTIGASAQQLSALAITAGAVLSGNVLYGTSYLPAAKLNIQVKAGATGQVFIGPSTVSNAGVNADITMAPGSGANAGDKFVLESQNDANVIDLSQYWIHGSHATDTVSVVYHQN